MTALSHISKSHLLALLGATCLSSVIAAPAYAGSYISGPTGITYTPGTVPGGAFSSLCSVRASDYTIESTISDRGIGDEFTEVIVDSAGNVVNTGGAFFVTFSQTITRDIPFTLDATQYTTATGSLRIGYQDTGANSPGTFLGLTPLPLADLRAAGGGCADIANNIQGAPVNGPPIAEAGPNQNRVLGQTPATVLDAINSSDPENDTLTYQWTQLSGPTVSISSSGPVLTASQNRSISISDPASVGVVVFQLSVDDGNGNSDTDTVSVTFANARVTNRAPTANAGSNQTLTGLQSGDTVRLDGRGSSDPDTDPLTYAWTVDSGNATLSNPTSSRPTLTFTGDGTDGASESVTVSLIVNDGTVSSAADSVVLTFVDDLAPTADAGMSQTVTGLRSGDTVTLDGTASSDPEGRPLTYAWSVVSGSATIADPTAAMPTLTYTGDGMDGAPEDVVVQLVVNDGRSNSAPDTTTITFADSNAPIANAGPDQSLIGLNTGDTVTLDGSSSSDPDGGTLTYMWSVVSGSATIADPTAVMPPLTYTGSGTDSQSEDVVVQLIVDDGTNTSAPDTVTLSFTDDLAPTADAGADQSFTGEGSGFTVNLDGTGSSDPEGLPLAYAWTVVSGSATLSDATAATPVLTYTGAGDDGVDEVVTLSLVVNDGRKDSAPDTVTLTFIDNFAPTADAGEDQVLFGLGNGDTVTLDGTGSSDPDGDTLSYAWSVTSGSATIAGETTATPTLTYTGDSSDLVDEDVVVELIVSDGLLSSAPDVVTLSFNDNRAPTARATVSNVNVNEGDVITLRGSDSSDPDSDTLIYSWVQTSGSSVVLSSANAANPTFTAPDIDAAETLIFELTVSDGRGLSSQATVEVNVSPRGTITIVQRSEGGDGQFGFTSAVSALNAAITTVNGVGQISSGEVAQGQYIVTAADTRAAGFALTDLVCNDGDSTVDVGSRTANITLAPGEDVTCTFTSVNSRGAAQAAIRNLVTQRGALILSNGPDRARRIDRLKGRAGQGGSGLSAGGMTVPGSSSVPVKARISENEMSFSSSMSQAKASRGMKTSGKGSVDVWAEGTFADLDGDGGDGRFSIVHGGADLMISDSVLVGVMGSVDSFRIDGASGVGEGEGDGFLAGPYITASLSDRLYFDGRVMLGSSDNTISPLGTFADDFDTDRVLIAGSLSGDFDWDGGYNFQPTVEVRHLSETQKAYTDRLGVTIDAEDFSLGEISFAPRLARSIALNNGWTARPYGQVEGIYSYGDNAKSVLGDSVRARIEGGIDMGSEAGVQAGISAFADGIGADRYSAQGVRVRVSFTLK